VPSPITPDTFCESPDSNGAFPGDSADARTEAEARETLREAGRLAGKGAMQAVDGLKAAAGLAFAKGQAVRNAQAFRGLCRKIANAAFEAGVDATLPDPAQRDQAIRLSAAIREARRKVEVLAEAGTEAGKSFGDARGIGAKASAAKDLATARAGRAKAELDLASAEAEYGLWLHESRILVPGCETLLEEADRLRAHGGTLNDQAGAFGGALKKNLVGLAAVLLIACLAAWAILRLF